MINYCTIDSTHTSIISGVTGGGANQKFSLRNTIVSNSTSQAVAWTSVTPLSVDYSDLWNSALVQGAVLDSGCVSINPLYQAPSDYHLKPFSPCRTLGENGTEMGAYGPGGGVSGVGGPHRPGPLALLPNWPNPFTDQTSIRFTLVEPMPVYLDVFDVAGRKVDGGTLMGRAGLNDIPWKLTTPRGTPTSGTYLYRLRAGNCTQSGKFTIAR
jgi:hypothetical protein